MATADYTGASEVSVVGECSENKRAGYFREELRLLKREIANEFENIHSMLREEEKKLQDYIDSRLESVHQLLTKREERVCQLKKGLEELEQGLAHNDLNHLLVDARIKIDREIRKLLHQEKIDLPLIHVQWSLTDLINCIPRVCTLVDSVHPYTYRSGPVVSRVNNEEKGGLVKPRGLALGKEGRVYVADYTKSRIEVYSEEGDHIESLADRNMREPLYLCVSKDSLYVSCENRCLLKLDLISGKRVSKTDTKLTVSGLCVDGEDGLIGCVWQKNCVYSFSEELEKRGEVLLATEHYKQGVTTTADVRVTRKQELAVLFYKSTHPVQVFSKEGVLISCLLSQEKVGGALYFCLDRLDNLLVTDIGAHQLRVFNPEGELIAKIGKKGQQEGEFQTPVGLAVNQHFDVYICDCKQNYMLQKF